MSRNTLLVANSFGCRWIPQLKQSSKTFRALWWDGNVVDVPSVRYWVKWADRVVAERDLAAALRNSGIDGVESIENPVVTSPADPRRDGGENVAGRERVMFFASNDTHVKTFLPIANFLDDSIFVVRTDSREGADDLLATAGADWVVNASNVLEELAPSVVLFGNDWGREERELIDAARRRSIPTACIQEGCLDFGRHEQRMMQADYALIQGAIVPTYLDRDFYLVTGNPRFDGLRRSARPNQPCVLINSNFTYGVYTEWRDRWVNSVAEACRQVEVDCFVSRHPRDEGSFPHLRVEPSDPQRIHELIRQSSVIVTRFSSIVYEAMLLDRPVIYFNPHGERMALFNEDKTGGISKVYDGRQLASEIRNALLTETGESSARRQRFLELHCGPTGIKSADRCARALRRIPAMYSVYRPKDFRRIGLIQRAKKRLKKWNAQRRAS